MNKTFGLCFELGLYCLESLTLYTRDSCGTPLEVESEGTLLLDNGSVIELTDRLLWVLLIFGLRSPRSVLLQILQLVLVGCPRVTTNSLPLLGTCRNQVKTVLHLLRESIVKELRELTNTEVVDGGSKRGWAELLLLGADLLLLDLAGWRPLTDLLHMIGCEVYLSSRLVLFLRILLVKDGANKRSECARAADATPL